MPGFKPPKTKEALVKMIVEMESQRHEWSEAQKPQPKPEKANKPKAKTPKGEPGEASKTLKKVSALKGAKQNAQDYV
jgi:hypothetical protein